MSLLSDFLKALYDEELDDLKKNLRLIGKERAVFNFLLNDKNSGKPKTEALKKLNLTSSHFDKINTVLLRKCYGLISPEEDLLFYLSQRHLVKHMLHEIKIKEKNSAGLTPEAIKALFDFVVQVPARYFNEMQSVKLGNKLIEISNDKVNIETYVRCRLLYAKMNVIRHGKPSGERLKKLFQEVEDFKSLAATHSFNSETKLWIYKTIAFFFKRINNDPQQHFFYLEKIKKLFADTYTLPLKEKAINDCNIAAHYYDANDLLKAQKLYLEIFNKYHHLLISEVRHIARLIELCIILNDLTQAEAIYRKYLRIFLKTGHEAFGVLAGIVYSKLLIYNKKYKEALKIIQRGKILNSRMVYYKYDVELRMLENILFALRKDYHFALELAHKNLKYISSQGISIKEFMHAHFFKLIIHLINYHVEEIPVPARVVNYYREYQNGELIIYGQLLKLIK